MSRLFIKDLFLAVETSPCAGENVMSLICDEYGFSIDNGKAIGEIGEFTIKIERSAYGMREGTADICIKVTSDYIIYCSYCNGLPDLDSLIGGLSVYQEKCNSFPSREAICNELKSLGYCDRVEGNTAYFDGYAAKVDRELFLKGKKIYAEYRLSASSLSGDGFRDRPHVVVTASNNLKRVTNALDFGSYDQKVKNNHAEYLRANEYTDRKDELTARAIEICQNSATKTTVSYVSDTHVNFSVSIAADQLEAFNRLIGGSN